MLTLAKIQTYESFGGDIDGFARDDNASGKIGPHSAAMPLRSRSFAVALPL